MLLGFEGVSKTPQNLIRTGECVLNLPSADQVDAVNRLAFLTGSNPVPAGKTLRGYRFEREKFEVSELTPVASETVAAARALDCPIHLEAKVVVNPVMADEYDYSVHERSGECTLEGIVCIEVRITPRPHASFDLDGWKAEPYRSGSLAALDHELSAVLRIGAGTSESRLAKIPEAMYRTPDVDRAAIVSSAKIK